MKLSITLLEKNSQIQDSISKALLPQAVSYMNKVIAQIKRFLPSIVENSIRNSPEYYSLINGKLKYEFGIPDSSSKLAGLLDIWMSNIVYDYQPPASSPKGIRSRFSAQMIRVNFDDVLFSSFAEVQDINRGYNLPWLKWLLLEGNRTIVDQHEVIIGPSKYSRTGNAIMKNSPTKSWQVPSEFSGTERDNWITRALDSVAPEIQSMLERALKQ